MFTKLLIANRGEIAVRIIRTARAQGYDTVAVYSDADADALHVREADEAVRIGPAAATVSYLSIEALIDAARRSGADAIHPGYGFLSENAAFAHACDEAGLIFIGPPAAAIELMGSKRRAKEAMRAAGVPTVPGYDGADQADSTLIREAERIGFPIMIKASAGGGGRGMRQVDRAGDLADALARARSEALSAFGSDELILEKAVLSPRHIEVQIFADRSGNTLHLGERDCSIQRRHQKVVEEAPSPFVDPELRKALGAAAVDVARACDYCGAGTVEFLVDDQRRFYFLEMNTRLQVEHPVTECVTGLDLVAWQLSVAAGEPLPLIQDQVRLAGHAIEVRLYAEAPARDYQPQTGTLLDWRPALGEGVRIDSGVATGSRVTPHYDPMLAKLIAWGPDRETARRRLRRALRESRIFGLTTNQNFLAEILAHPDFIAGRATTAFLQTAFREAASLRPPVPDPRLIAAATVLHYRRGNGTAWSNSLPTPVALELAVGDDETLTISILPTEDGYRIRWGQTDITLAVIKDDGTALVIAVGGHRQCCQYLQRGDHVHCQLAGQSLHSVDRTHAPAQPEAGNGDGEVKASMDGAVIAVHARPGMTVRRGQVMVVLEAMKMEHPLLAGIDGQVENVLVEAGSQVRQRQTLITIAPNMEQ